MSDEARKTKTARDAWRIIAHQLGPLAKLLDRDDLSELSVNPDGSVWVEQRGHAHMVRLDEMMSEDARRSLIRTVATWANSVCDEDSPDIAAQLPILGFRFQGQVEPAVLSPQFTIRMGRGFKRPLQDYIDEGSMTPIQANILHRAIQEHQNILVAGATGSGKTTLLNSLLGELGENCPDRVYLIEDVREIVCDVPNQVSVLVNRQTAYDYEHALFVAMRQRPERIIVGELRDGAATQALLKAWNTGHPGGLASTHANSTLDGLLRLESLLQELSDASRRTLIASVVDVVVFIEKLRIPRGTLRCVTDVAKVSRDLDERGDFILDHHHHNPQRI